MGIAEDIIIILVLGLITAFISHKLKAPLFFGYIVTGIIIGPYTGGITVSNVHDIELLSEIGVALLLFSIGLELSFKELKEVKKIALIGTPVQIFLSSIAGIGAGKIAGFSVSDSVIFGLIISLSSTMIALKLLMNRKLMGTLSSRVMIGILIVQDLAAIPMMIMIPKLFGSSSQDLPGIGFTLLVALNFLAVIIILGIKVLPLIFRAIAKLDSPELFLLSVTAIGLGIGYLSFLAGLSFAFGAFLAGMVINQSDYSHKALSDIIPLRDIFGLLFFVSIGMLFNPAYFLSHLNTILFLVGAVIVSKFIIFFFLSKAFGYFNIIPLAVGFGLAQIGEFSFVIATLGLKEKVISQDLYSMILSTTVITMFVSPFLSMLPKPLYAVIKKRFYKESVQTVNLPKAELENHVIIAGGGRVGQSVADILAKLEMPFVIIEQDFRRFEQLKKKKYPAIYGDASQDTVFEAARVRQSRLLLLTIPSIIVSRQIISISRNIKPDIKIIARTESMEQIEEMLRLNIYEVVQPEFEASLELIRQILFHYGMHTDFIQKTIDNIRYANYSPFCVDNISNQSISCLKNVSSLFQMYWFEIPASGFMANKSIKELELRTKTGASVVGVFRNNVFYANPEPDFVFTENDLVAAIGDAKSEQLFKDMVNKK